MSAVEPLCRVMGVKPSSITRGEYILLEANLFAGICEELKEIFREEYKEYFQLMRFTVDMENIMLDTKLTCLIIKDILSTDEYNIQGIAHYTGTFEDVIEEIVTERNTSPSANFLRKLIDLHRMVRRDLYDVIFKKIQINITRSVKESLAIEAAITI